MKSRPHLQRSVSVIIKGKKHIGCYYLDRDSITVHYGAKGTSPTLIGSQSAEVRARELLLGLIDAN